MQNWLKTVLMLGLLAAPAVMLSAESTTPAIARPAHAHGVHGMVLFGEPGRIFASHLPLYRHPHNWQVVLELEPVDEAGQKLTNTLLEHGGLFTLEPERFDLWRLKPDAREPLKRFSAVLYRDHFERGGERLQALEWQVKRTWVFEAIHIEFPPEAGHRYYQIGREERDKKAKFWLLHKVERVPDTDQIVEICTSEHREPGLFKSATLLESQREDLDNCLGIPLWHVQVLWQDTDDLQ